jgi:hypothetical protein
MKPSLRHGLLGAALLLTLLAVWYSARTAPPEAPATPARLAQPAAAAAAPPASERLDWSDVDVFATHDWQPPAAVALDATQVAAPPRKPQAPPLPYRYIGRWEENDELTVFVSRDNQPTSIHARQLLDKDWLVDGITPTRVTFIYIPLKQRVVMTLENPE